MRKLAWFLLFWALLAVCAGAAHAENVEVRHDWLERRYTEDDKTLATLYAYIPQLIGMDDEEAMEHVNAAIQAFVLAECGFDLACEVALDDYRNAPENFAEIEYGLMARAMVTLRTDSLLAVWYEFELETGGPHPWHTIAARHYDLRTGEPVALETLMRDPEAFRERVAEELSPWLSSSIFEAPDEEADHPLGELFERCLLTRSGLLVFLNEGELGPVSDGAREFTIPYEHLEGELTADTNSAAKESELTEWLTWADALYGEGCVGWADELVDRALSRFPDSLDAYLTRARGYKLNLEFLDDQDMLLETLAKAESLAAGDESNTSALAWVYYAQAWLQYDPTMYSYLEPVDEGYDVCMDTLRKLELAIELDPTGVDYYYLLYDMMDRMGLYDEAAAAKARGDILENPEDPQGYSELITALDSMELFEESAEVYARMLALADPPGTAHAYQQAETLFAAGEYEASLPLYEQAIEEEVYTSLAMIHRFEALMRLERYGEALDAAKAGEELTGENWVFSCCIAEAYVKLGDVRMARLLFEEVLSNGPQAYQRALDGLAAIRKMLPPGAAEAFASERWAGWEVTATGFDEEWLNPGMMVAALRKDGNSVLCVLRRTGAGGAYTVVLENDKALYPGERTPRINYVGLGDEPLITIEYEEDLGGGIPARNGFSFFDDDGQFAFLWAYREIPEPGGYEYEDLYGYVYYSADICRYKIAKHDGAASITRCWRYAGEEWNYNEEFLADVNEDLARFALAVFDIAECDALFDAAMADD